MYVAGEYQFIYFIMKNLLSAILIVLFIAGCGIFGDDGSDKKEFEPYMVGNWLVTSPQKAVWQGEAPKTKQFPMMGDTVRVKGPDRKDLTIKRDTSGDYIQHGDQWLGFDIVLTDSSFSSSDSISTELVKMETGHVDGLFIKKITASVANSFIRTTAGVRFNIDDHPTGKPEFKVHYINKDTVHVITHDYAVGGMYGTMVSISSN